MWQTCSVAFILHIFALTVVTGSFYAAIRLIGVTLVTWSDATDNFLQRFLFLTQNFPKCPVLSGPQWGLLWYYTALTACPCQRPGPGDVDLWSHPVWPCSHGTEPVDTGITQCLPHFSICSTAHRSFTPPLNAFWEEGNTPRFEKRCSGTVIHGRTSRIFNHFIQSHCTLSNDSMILISFPLSYEISTEILHWQGDRTH